MPKRHAASRRTTGATMEQVTERHTQWILTDANMQGPPRSGIPNPGKVAERLATLAQKGLRALLEAGTEVSVHLPGKRMGIAVGITPEGFVRVKDWNDVFSPEAVSLAPP